MNARTIIFAAGLCLAAGAAWGSPQDTTKLRPPGWISLGIGASKPIRGGTIGVGNDRHKLIGPAFLLAANIPKGSNVYGLRLTYAFLMREALCWIPSEARIPKIRTWILDSFMAVERRLGDSR